MIMIEKIKILELVNQALEGSDKFLVNLKITPDNRIYVDIDGDNGVTIDDCIELSRAIEGQLDRDEEDFALDVSSAGADQPLKLTRQLVKNIGREVEAVTFDGQKTVGELTAADEATVTLRTPGTKKQAPQEVVLQRRDVKSVKVVIKF
ncbi:MAG: ribosome assembly cofactor RimP [Bacteroidales bacterium]|nr:ribosome assembly cofactor RimP [Bacteroidales bacterium]